MTDREKAIVMAHTGVCMLTGDKFQIFHRYVEEIMGRPVLTHEIGRLADAIKEKSTTDFLALCREVEESEDCVSRQAVLDIVDSYSESRSNIEDVTQDIISDIMVLPFVTPQQKTGHWIEDVDRWGDIVTTVNGYRCSRCNAFNTDKDNYCPNCGAKMQEVEE